MALIWHLSLMQLLTAPLTEALLKAGGENMKPICKFFNPIGAATWLITGMEDDNDTLWGYADLGMGCVEFGTISLSELVGLRLPMGLAIERDLHFNADTFPWTPKDLLGAESLGGFC
jgi:Protein of unknown function (DUF2958)